MRWLLLLALLRPPGGMAQETTASPSPQTVPSVPLPESPGAVVQTYHQTASVTTPSPCRPAAAASQPSNIVGDQPSSIAGAPCPPAATGSPYQRFLNSPAPFPLTPRQKGLLAVHDLLDPGNLFTIAANAGFTVGIDPHTAYGPGWAGFGRDVGYSLVQDATGEFFSTFVFDSLFHEDPHYHRSPQASMPRRFLHAVSHTVVSQHDDGRPMPNYSTLLTYPLSAEMANLYVPGVHGNGESTVARIVTGLASDPIDNLITEFLPDFAKRVHVHVIFFQQIINNVATGQPGI